MKLAESEQGYTGDRCKCGLMIMLTEARILGGTTCWRCTVQDLKDELEKLRSTPLPKQKTRKKPNDGIPY